MPAVSVAGTRSFPFFARKVSTNKRIGLCRYKYLETALYPTVFETLIGIDGFEETFAVNHLSHFLLVNLLLDSFVKNGRVIFVSSGTHDPKKKTGMPKPIYESGKLLAHPEKTTDETIGTLGRRRYRTA